ncbi:thioredoxin family protein [Echinicola pacifica]|nr:thioredoxin fold domain-containing protein [Echinicola pacifica]
MKRLLALAALVLVTVASQAQNKAEIKWYSFEEAVALNEEEPKMVLVDVYTDWCGWCKKMDKETFTDAAVVEYLNENFYAVKLDAENTKETFEFKGEEYTQATMAQSMQVRSYPNFVIINETMENITQLPGYRPADTFLKDLKTTLEQFK